MCFGIEYVDESFADDFTFTFGVGNAFEFFEELLAGIYTYNVQSQTFIIVHYVLEFVLTEHSVVYEDAGKVLADGFIQ